MSAVEAMRALYGQPQRAEPMRRQLPEIGAGLQAQFEQLHARPTPDAAERLALNLDAARLAVLRYREAMVREVEGGAFNDAA